MTDEVALLAAIAGVGEPGLTDALDRLVAADLVFRRGFPREPIYAFKHALVQEAAYQSLLRNRRQQLHARVAMTIEASGAGEGGEPLEILAYHLTEAGLPARALPAWLAAGERAWRRSAIRRRSRTCAGASWSRPAYPGWRAGGRRSGFTPCSA